MRAAMSSAISLDADRAIDVGRPAVALEVRRDDLVAVRQGRQDRAEHLARAEAAVEEDERAPGSPCLVVDVEAVDVGVLAGAGRSRWSNRWSSSRAPREGRLEGRYRTTEPGFGALHPRLPRRDRRAVRNPGRLSVVRREKVSPGAWTRGGPHAARRRARTGWPQGGSTPPPRSRRGTAAGRGRGSPARRRRRG